VWQSLRSIGLRAMDGIEAGTLDAIRDHAARVAGVVGIEDARARWLGHVVRAELKLAVDPDASVRAVTETAEAVREAVIGGVEHITEVSVELVPAQWPRTSA
jgi:divalent metal cation (Fe/Co/Zn/Cd) transporter